MMRLNYRVANPTGRFWGMAFKLVRPYKNKNEIIIFIE